MDLGEIWWEGVDWTHQAQDGNQWRTLLNTYRKRQEIFDWLSDCQLLKKDCASWSELARILRFLLLDGVNNDSLFCTVYVKFSCNTVISPGVFRPVLIFISVSFAVEMKEQFCFTSENLNFEVKRTERRSPPMVSMRFCFILFLSTLALVFVCSIYCYSANHTPDTLHSVWNCLSMPFVKYAPHWRMFHVKLLDIREICFICTNEPHGAESFLRSWYSLSYIRLHNPADLDLKHHRSASQEIPLLLWDPKI